MRSHLYILIILTPLFAIGQQNVVPNPSFEEHTGCPNSNGKIWLATPWDKVGEGGGMSYYHECGSSCCSIPVNNIGTWGGGGGYAHTGQAYVEMKMWIYNYDIHNFYSEGNFLGTSLIHPLETGKKYDVEFYLSLWDSVWYAGKNIGVHLSTGQPDGGIDNLLSLVPQVRYEGDFLTDKEGWMKVEGSFIAQGGEDFITIGNFDGYHKSEALFVDGAILPPNLPHYWKVAYYYIDDVSVVEDSSSGLEEVEGVRFRLWPNPAFDGVTIETEGGKTLEMYDMAGRILLRSSLSDPSKSTINIAHLPEGVYVATIVFEDGTVLRKKLMKQ